MNYRIFVIDTAGRLLTHPRLWQRSDEAEMVLRSYMRLKTNSQDTLFGLFLWDCPKIGQSGRGAVAIRARDIVDGAVIDPNSADEELLVTTKLLKVRMALHENPR